MFFLFTLTGGRQSRGGKPETRMSTTTGGRSNVPIHDLTVLTSDKLSYLSPPLLNLTTNLVGNPSNYILQRVTIVFFSVK